MMADGITRAEVREIALGAIAGWADGWTGDDGVNPQRRVRVAGGDTGYVDLRVEGAPGTGEPDRLFRVTAVVTETLPSRPSGLIEGSGRRGAPRDLPSSPRRGDIAPFETGEPFRSAAEADWDGSRGYS